MKSRKWRPYANGKPIAAKIDPTRLHKLREVLKSEPFELTVKSGNGRLRFTFYSDQPEQPAEFA